jgi:hypothetical protein
MADVSVRRYDHIKSGGLGDLQEFAVFQSIPSPRPRLGHRVTIDEVSRKCARRSVVEQNSIYARAAGTGDTSALRAANSRTAWTCSRVTPNSSTSSSTVMS